MYNEFKLNFLRDTDEEVKEILNKKLMEILIEERETGQITVNEKEIFSRVVNSNQLEVFSNPKTKGLVSPNQSYIIHSLINQLNYFNKKDAKIRVRISERYFFELRLYPSCVFIRTTN